jgi:hypothetical protein
MATTLERELATYRRELDTLKTQSGKYVLISGDDVLGTWVAYEDALQEGYRMCGLERRFMVKKIDPYQRPAFISRMVPPACHRSSPH